MALKDLTKIYDGANLSGANAGVIYLPIVADGTLNGVDILTDEAVTGDVVFALKKNGVAVAGAGAITITTGNKIGTVSGLSVAVVKGDEFTLDMTSGAVSVPLTLNLSVDDGVSASLSQTSQTFTTSSIVDTQTVNEDISIAKHSIVRKISSTAECRVRAYSTSAYRFADAGRAIGVENNSAGLLLEVVFTTGSLDLDARSSAIFVNADSPVSDKIYFAIQNLSGSDRTIDITLEKLTLEN